MDQFPMKTKKKRQYAGLVVRINQDAADALSLLSETYEMPSTCDTVSRMILFCAERVTPAITKKPLPCNFELAEEDESEIPVYNVPIDQMTAALQKLRDYPDTVQDMPEEFGELYSERLNIHTSCLDLNMEGLERVKKYIEDLARINEYRAVKE